MSNNSAEYDDEEEEMEESDEGECESSEDDDDSEGEYDNCDPGGLFDALAAANEASQLMNNDSTIDETNRLPQDFLVAAYTKAIKYEGVSISISRPMLFCRTNWTLTVDAQKESQSEEENWREGERVMAVYYVDGVQYEAKILRLKRWKKAAVVRFYDYNNEEEVKFSDLVKIRKKPSKV